ncbi:MAG: sodium-independent anion transporter [Chlorobaculum sp.]|nr:sodium-independent anion transporter [Chlorobaculum sp.]
MPPMMKLMPTEKPTTRFPKSPYRLSFQSYSTPSSSIAQAATKALNPIIAAEAQPESATTTDKASASRFVTTPAGSGRNGALIRSVSTSNQSFSASTAVGLNMLKELAADCQKTGTKLILSGVHAQPIFAMQQYGLADMIGEENIHGNIDDALDRARQILGLPKEGRPEGFVASVKREEK